MSYYQGQKIEKKTCTATGKTIFSHKADADEARAKLTGFNKVLIAGRRIKHRAGKPQLKRSYYCEFCEGWHLTSMNVINPKTTKGRLLTPGGKLKKFRY